MQTVIIANKANQRTDQEGRRGGKFLPIVVVAVAVGGDDGDGDGGGSVVLTPCGNL